MASVNLKHQLGLSLLKELIKEEKANIVFSPLSLGTAFAMLATGLKGDSKDELLGLLGCTDQDVVNDLYSSMVCDKDLPVRIANKYIAQQNIKVEERFSSFLTSKYESEVEIVNFKTEGRAVEKKVNAWVAEKTADMIKELLPSNSLTADTILVLLNAVYFKGTWAQEFHPIPTKLDFNLRDGTVVKKDFMTKTSNKFLYHETEDIRLVKIPYNEADCYMVIVLPLDETKQIDEIILQTTPASLATAIAELSDYVGPAVELTMPKFKIEYTFKDVKKYMKMLGVTKIFQAGVGDFSDMFSNTEVSEKTEVSSITHKCVIEVDEKGTEAAAATAIGVAMYCSMPMETVVVVDRAFYFLVAAKDGTPIFSGICADP